MQFSRLTLAHSGSPEGDYDAIHELVTQACFAETMGFDGLWLTEHNFTGESVYCDPIPFASVVAARTSRIRIGFAVRFVHVAESQAQAEDELTRALLLTRRHMVLAREVHNPADFHVEATRVNPWNDPRVSDEDGVRYSLETATLCGTSKHVADRLGELRDAGVHHVLCQMSYGYLSQAAIMGSMRRFGDEVIPRFR